MSSPSNGFSVLPLSTGVMTNPEDRCEVCGGPDTEIYVDQFYLSRRRRLFGGWSEPEVLTMQFRLCASCAGHLREELGEAARGWWETEPGVKRMSWRTMWKRE